MTTNLVVADPERSTGTLCLAVTPAMKALGVKNRCRVYEIPDRIDYIRKDCGCKFYYGSDAHHPKSFETAAAELATWVRELALTEEDRFRPFNSVEGEPSR